MDQEKSLSLVTSGDAVVGFADGLARLLVVGELVMFVGAVLSLTVWLWETLIDRCYEYIQRLWMRVFQFIKVAFWLAFFALNIWSFFNQSRFGSDNKHLEGPCGNFTLRLHAVKIYHSNVDQLIRAYKPLQLASDAYIRRYIDLYSARRAMLHAATELKDPYIPQWISFQESAGQDTQRIEAQVDNLLSEMRFEQSKCSHFQDSIASEYIELINTMRLVKADVQHEVNARKKFNILTISNQSSPAIGFSTQSLHNMLASASEATSLLNVMSSEFWDRERFCMENQLTDIRQAWLAAKSGVTRGSKSDESRRALLASLEKARSLWSCL